MPGQWPPRSCPCHHRPSSLQFLIDKNGCVVKRYGPMEEPLVGAFWGANLVGALGGATPYLPLPTGDREGPALLSLVPQAVPLLSLCPCPQSLLPCNHDGPPANQPCWWGGPENLACTCWRKVLWPRGLSLVLHPGCLVGIKCRNPSLCPAWGWGSPQGSESCCGIWVTCSGCADSLSWAPGHRQDLGVGKENSLRS